MGIFDTVKGKFYCPFCGASIEDFQIKDLKSSVAIFELNLPVNSDFPSREMHTNCEKCNSWISINLSESNLKQLR